MEIEQYPGKTLVALSGGADSVALLRLLTSTPSPLTSNPSPLTSNRSTTLQLPPARGRKRPRRTVLPLALRTTRRPPPRPSLPDPRVRP